MASNTNNVAAPVATTEEDPLLLSRPYHILQGEDVVNLLKSSSYCGLFSDEAEKRLVAYGKNQLPSKPGPTTLERIWVQVNSVLIYVLLVGAALSFAFNHLADAIVILGVIVVNVSVGYFMEGKAESTTAALKNMMSPSAIVLRDDDRMQIESKDVVIGDIFFLQPGDVVPADGRVLQAVELTVLEAPLTGESHAVVKTSEANKKEDTPLAERSSMVFSGTQVLKGSATCIAVGTGSRCEIGKINNLLGEVEALKTPLTIQLEIFGRYLATSIILVSFAALGAALGRSYSIDDSFSFAIGIAVAAIPEGLPSCVTITFAIGVYKMAKKGAIIKSLPAVETLGSVSVICSDKTGTLTINKMTVKSICTKDTIYKLADDGTVESQTGKETTDPVGHMIAVLLPGILCNDTSILIDDPNFVSPPTSPNVSTRSAVSTVSTRPLLPHGVSDESKDLENPAALVTSSEMPAFEVQGDPTESCIITLLTKLINPLETRRLKKSYPRVEEQPFDSAVKYMATMHDFAADELVKFLQVDLSNHPLVSNGWVRLVFIKGAPEKVAKFADPADFEYWASNALKFAKKGKRVLGLAYKVVPRRSVLESELQAEKLQGFTMTALVGIIDPPRPEAIEAVKSAQQAGIVVKMITGDHPVTAAAIGKAIGLHVNKNGTITGNDLDQFLNNNDLVAFDKVVLENDIFARTSPEHKLRIVQSLQRQNICCSMTGDGVNDAPALKAANIGVAMGITGTEVAKDAANMVITDDNFATIVDAVRIGRCTYNNLVKILAFVLPTNGGQAFSIVMALAIGLEVPITALQILWVNMVTSITLGLVLAFEEPHPSIMTMSPRRSNKAIFGKFLTWRVLFVAAMLVSAVIGIFQWEKRRIDSVDKLRCISVNMLSVAQIAYLFSCRNLRDNVNPISMLTGNYMIWVGIFAVAVFQVLFTYAPPFQYVFHTENIDGESWGKICLLSVVIFIAVELEKFFANLRNRFSGPHKQLPGAPENVDELDAYEEL